MPNIRWLLALVTAVHRFLYRATGGRVGSRLAGNPMLLLDNRGRKTGKLRTTPLLWVPDGPRYLIIASNAGDERYPAWYLNLCAHPDTRIQVGARHIQVHARVAGPDERKDLWRKALDAYPAYAEYEKRTSREIPVVVLEPRE